MKTTIEFNSPASKNEWSSFKGKLSGLKEGKAKDLLRKEGDYSNMIAHLSTQLNLSNSTAHAAAA